MEEVDNLLITKQWGYQTIIPEEENEKEISGLYQLEIIVMGTLFMDENLV